LTIGLTATGLALALPASPVTSTPQSTLSWAVLAAPSQLSFALSLTYAERIFVPAGSELNVRVYDAAGRVVFEQTTATAHAGPPYVVQVSIQPGVSFPLKVEAALASRLGHRFSESAELSEADLQGSVVIRMRQR
jgi:uncharacterized lipoprotein YbaY